MENIKRQEQCNALIISIHLPLRIDDVCACARTQQKLYNNSNVGLHWKLARLWRRTQHTCNKPCVSKTWVNRHIGWFCFGYRSDIFSNFSIVHRAYDAFLQRYTLQNLWFNGHKCTLHQLTNKTFTAFRDREREGGWKKEEYYLHSRWTVPLAAVTPLWNIYMYMKTLWASVYLIFNFISNIAREKSIHKKRKYTQTGILLFFHYLIYFNRACAYVCHGFCWCRLHVVSP